MVFTPWQSNSRPYLSKIGSRFWRSNFWTARRLRFIHMTSQRPYWCPKTMKRRPCWCPKPVPWELNSFLMQTLSFVTINLHICLPREWKHSIPDSFCKTILDKASVHTNRPFVCEILNLGKFCLWNLESWALEYGTQLKESGIPLTNGIQGSI